MNQARGFSLVEMLLATAILLLLAAAVFSLVEPGGSIFVAQAEAADVHQRLRVAVATLDRDLRLAGAGPSRGQRAGPLASRIAPILPFRLTADAPGSARPDAITLVYVPDSPALASLEQAIRAESTVATIRSEPGCPVGDSLCGFEPGQHVLIVDDNGAFGVFTVTAAAGSSLTLRHEMPDSGYVFAAGSTMAHVECRAYSLRDDAATGVSQLIRREGNRDVPVLDHVVGLTFEYYGRSLGGSGVVRMAPTELGDGPWLPSGLATGRFDADLLRLRRVTVRLRVQAADETLRGPAGLLFARGGTSSGGHRLVPDREVTLDVWPRNLNLPE